MNEYHKILQESRTEAMKVASNEIYQLLGEQISVLSDYADRNLPKTKVRLLEESCDRLTKARGRTAFLSLISDFKVVVYQFTTQPYVSF